MQDGEIMFGGKITRVLSQTGKDHPAYFALSFFDMKSI